MDKCFHTLKDGKYCLQPVEAGYSSCRGCALSYSQHQICCYQGCSYLRIPKSVYCVNHLFIGLDKREEKNFLKLIFPPSNLRKEEFLLRDDRFNSKYVEFKLSYCDPIMKEKEVFFNQIQSPLMAYVKKHPSKVIFKSGNVMYYGDGEFIFLIESNFGKSTFFIYKAREYKHSLLNFSKKGELTFNLDFSKGDYFSVDFCENERITIEYIRNNRAFTEETQVAFPPSEERSHLSNKILLEKKLREGAKFYLGMPPRYDEVCRDRFVGKSANNFAVRMAFCLRDGGAHVIFLSTGVVIHSFYLKDKVPIDSFELGKYGENMYLLIKRDSVLHRLNINPGREILCYNEKILIEKFSRRFFKHKKFSYFLFILKRITQ